MSPDAHPQPGNPADPANSPRPPRPGEPAHESSRDPTVPPSAAKPVRRRRWPRRVGIAAAIIVVLLAVLVAFAPAIASQRSVWGFGLSVANDKLVGVLQADDVSLSWSGPTTI